MSIHDDIRNHNRNRINNIANNFKQPAPPVETFEKNAPVVPETPAEGTPPAVDPSTEAE